LNAGERATPGAEERRWRADQRVPEGDDARLGLAGAAEIRALLSRARNVAMVGLSADEVRPSYYVAVYLKGEGYNLFPVNPRYAGGLILGRPVVASLRDITAHIDIVDIFRRPSEVPSIVDDAIAIGADAVWMQLGVVNEEAARRARAASLTVVMDRCMKIEHGRHLGRMRTMGLATGIISARRRGPP
jgi:predicted CoA-binding protein